MHDFGKNVADTFHNPLTPLPHRQPIGNTINPQAGARPTPELGVTGLISIDM